MKLGLCVPLRRYASAELIRTLGTVSEQLGFDSLWVGEHVVMFDDHKSDYPLTGTVMPGDPDDNVEIALFTSLAYLAAAIPFAMERCAGGIREPVVISTRTKLLQDQLLGKDIGAAARFLGYPDLRALSIKGRANYACARRLQVALSRGRDPSVFPEQRLANTLASRWNRSNL